MPDKTAAKNIDRLIQGIDVLEESIRSIDKKLLDILLSDRTTHRNILWATQDYSELGTGFEEFSEITPAHVTGRWASLIQPRIAKAQSTQAGRTRDKAEVFTPSWICNKQNNLVDEQWFGRKDVFNREIGETWKNVPDTVSFENVRKDWTKYVDAQRLEISCGEAPYLVSRYDTVTGDKIPLQSRIGLLDRKMRIVNENAASDDDWLFWSKRAFESIYGFEYQGDNLLLARENLLYSYIEYYTARFNETPSIRLLRKIALIISWNIWQMDGLKYVVPGSCHATKDAQISLFEDDEQNIKWIPCAGCEKGDIHAHTGIYCRIMDWRYKCSRTYISMMKGDR